MPSEDAKLYMILMVFSALLRYRFWICRILLLILVGISSCEAAILPPDWDPSREQAWAEWITARLRVGEVVWLPSPLGKFLTLYTQSIGRGPSYGAVVLLPSPTTHPDSDPISRLRTRLPLHGWYTLAIQLPTMIVDSSPATYEYALPAACARLNEAITWFEGRNINNIIVLGHGLGAAVAAACVAESKSKDSVHGLILLGAGGPARIEPLPSTLNPASLLKKINLPIFDLYGEDDLPAVLAGAQAREAGRRNREPRYVQAEIPGAGHRLRGVEEIVVGRVAGWLRHYVAGR